MFRTRLQLENRVWFVGNSGWLGKRRRDVIGTFGKLGGKIQEWLDARTFQEMDSDEGAKDQRSDGWTLRWSLTEYNSANTLTTSIEDIMRYQHDQYKEENWPYGWTPRDSIIHNNKYSTSLKRQAYR